MMASLAAAHLAVPLPARQMPFALSHMGPAALAEPLGAALRAQWTYGFPIVPKPGLQLTHGFLQYPAGMQALAAAHMLDVMPQGTILDPFVGGGTTLVEAIRSGRQAVGADASPLALFAAAHHTWRAEDTELATLREQVRVKMEAMVNELEAQLHRHVSQDRALRASNAAVHRSEDALAAIAGDVEVLFEAGD